MANGLAAFYIATGNDPACTVGWMQVPEQGKLSTNQWNDATEAESQAAVTHFDLVNPSGGP